MFCAEWILWKTFNTKTTQFRYFGVKKHKNGKISRKTPLKPTTEKCIFTFLSTLMLKPKKVRFRICVFDIREKYISSKLVENYLHRLYALINIYTILILDFIDFYSFIIVRPELPFTFVGNIFV